MADTLRLAAKNLLRNKRRTILTGAIITVGVAMLLFAQAFLASMTEGWKRGITEGAVGHLQVVAKGYKAKKTSFSLGHSLKHATQLAGIIAGDPSVASVTRQISIAGLVSTGENTSPFFGGGVDVATLPRTLPGFYAGIVDGEPFSGEPGEALVGKGLMETLGTKVGEELMLVTYDKYQAMNAAEVRVRGVAQVPDDTVNDNLVVVDFETARKLVGFDDEATELIVRTRSLPELDETIRHLRTVGTGQELEFYKWSDLSGQLRQVEGMFLTFSTVLGFVVGVIVLIGLANTVLMGVFERVREIGTMMALGFSRLRVSLIFVAESVCLGAVGTIAAVAIHYAIVAAVNRNGIPMAPPGSNLTIYLFLHFSWHDAARIGVGVLGVSVCAALYPASLAARMNPVEAIR